MILTSRSSKPAIYLEPTKSVKTGFRLGVPYTVYDKPRTSQRILIGVVAIQFTSGLICQAPFCTASDKDSAAVISNNAKSWFARAISLGLITAKDEFHNFDIVFANAQLQIDDVRVEKLRLSLGSEYPSLYSEHGKHGH